MGIVYDKHEEELQPLHEFLKTNKMSFEQFLRTFNFVQDLNKGDMSKFIEAYKNGELVNHGWY